MAEDDKPKPHAVHPAAEQAGEMRAWLAQYYGKAAVERQTPTPEKPAPEYPPELSWRFHGEAIVIETDCAAQIFPDREFAIKVWAGLCHSGWGDHTIKGNC